MRKCTSVESKVNRSCRSFGKELRERLALIALFKRATRAKEQNKERAKSETAELSSHGKVCYIVFYTAPSPQSWARYNSVATISLCFQGTQLYVIAILLYLL